MKLWKLYDEEASDDPLITEAQLRTWVASAGLSGTTKLSTVLLPPLLSLLPERINYFLLAGSDGAMRHIPGVKREAGVIIGEATEGSAGRAQASRPTSARERV